MDRITTGTGNLQPVCSSNIDDDLYALRVGAITQAEYERRQKQKKKEK
jgi:hypothetical protein